MDSSDSRIEKNNEKELGLDGTCKCLLSDLAFGLRFFRSPEANGQTM